MNLLFFKLAFRNILRNKLHSLINITGLSTGIAVILFIFLFVRSETSYDNFHPDGNRIYRVIETMQTKNDNTVAGLSCYPDAPDIMAAIPGVESFCRISDASPIKCFKKNQIFKIEKIRFADDDFFSFFSFRLLAGNPATALNSADKIVLTHSTAQRIFGKDEPLGQNIVYDQKVLTVSGISEDIPENTVLKYDALISTRYLEQDKENFWIGWAGGMRFLSFLKLMPGISPGQIEAGFPDLAYDKINRKNEGSGFFLSLSLQNIRNIHLSNGTIDYDCSGNRSRSSIMIVAGIGLFILLLAVINYISLYIVQKNEKIRNISLLTVHGAGRWQLEAQAYIEVLIMAVFSSLLGLYLFTLFVPLLNSFLNTTVTLRGHLIQAILFVASLIVILSLIITLFSIHGISKFKLTESIKGNSLPGGSKNVMSTFLITFQFIIVIVFVVAMFVMNRQNSYIANMEYGFNKENIISVFRDKEFILNELTSFRNDLLTIPEVNNVSLTSQGMGTGLTMNGYHITGEDGNVLLNVIYADASFLDCFGIKLLSGRNFKPDTQQDNFSILVNQKLVQRAGWKDPINKTIDRNGKMTVIGTVEDFNFASLYSDIKPLIIMCNPSYDGWGYNCINIRYKTSDISALREKISRIWETEYPGITYDISFLDDQLNSNYKLLDNQQRIVRFFSLLSILIACLGLFGLTSFIAGCRVKEIGIRKINGAKVSELMLMLNVSFLKWITGSVVIAIPLAWYVMRLWLKNFAYKTDVSWWIFSLACILVLCIAILTVSWQSFRAANMNPVEALRYE